MAWGDILPGLYRLIVTILRKKDLILISDCVRVEFQVTGGLSLKKLPVSIPVSRLLTFCYGLLGKTQMLKMLYGIAVQHSNVLQDLECSWLTH